MKEKERIHPRSMFGSEENARRKFKNFLLRMEIGVPTTPLGQGNPLKEGNVSQTGFPASFPADMWARKNQNSFIRGNAERGIP